MTDTTQKRLIVLDNASDKIKIEHVIDSETDIIVISNGIVNKDDIHSYIEEACHRSVDMIPVKNLTTTEVLKRMTYNLIKNSSFTPKDSHVELFDKLSKLAMGNVTMTNMVTALLTNVDVNEVSTKVDQCMKLLTVEKELSNSSTIMLHTCNALIKSTVSQESQMLLNSLSIVGLHGIPIPYFIIMEIEKLIVLDPLTLESCFKELENSSLIYKYPQPCVHGNTVNQHIELYYIPKLICNSMWEQTEDAEHLLGTLMLLKAIELNISEDTNDNIKLELLFEIVTIVYNHSDNDQVLSKCMYLRLKITYSLQ